MALSGYGRKCKLTIQNSKVPGTLSDFPILLDLTNLPSEMFDADGSYPALNGGLDVKFSSDSAGETQLACEIVTFTINNDPALGEVEIHVKVPSVASATDTDFYVWYNKAGDTLAAETDTYGKHNVWDSNYKLVQHMDQDPSGSSPQMVDSTSNSNDGTSRGTMLSGDLVTGKIGDGLDFDGIDDDIDLGDTASLSFGDGTDDTPFTMSAFVKPASIPEWGNVLCKGDGTWNTGEYQFVLHDDPSGSIGIRTVDESAAAHFTKITDAGYVTAGNWLHMVAAYDGVDTNGFLIYANGSSVAFTDGSDGTYVAMENTTKKTFIGSRNINRFFPGIIDEVRQSNIVRSPNWIETEYNNQNAPATFIIEGTPETPGVDGNPFFLFANGLGGNTLGGNCSLMG